MVELDTAFVLFPCVICGVSTVSTIVTGQYWLSDIRAIYTLGHDWSTARCSGVGGRRAIDDNFARVPEDYDCNSNHHRVKLAKKDFVAVEAPQVYDLGYVRPADAAEEFNAAGNKPWGFFVHDTCWRLLQTVRPLSDDDVKLLSGFCRSCINVSLPDFGHDYGGLYPIDNAVGIHGERYGGTITGRYANSLEHETSCSDPLRASALRKLVRNSTVKKRGCETRGFPGHFPERLVGRWKYLSDYRRNY